MAIERPMPYCSTCGSSRMHWRVPAGDNRRRQVCDDCGTVHYQNPRNVAGVVAECEGRILLCRRAIEPRSGFWTIPAGFMENGESLVAAAARETEEEARAAVTDVVLYGLFSLPNIGQVYAIFRGLVTDGRAAPGDESLEVGWFDEDGIPWSELAFPVVHEALRLYFEDRRRGHFPVHMGDIFRRDNGPIVIRHHDGTELPSPIDLRREQQ